MGERRQSWGAKVRIAGAETLSGCDQTEQRCWNCCRVKITIHPPHGLPYLAWRFPGDPQQFTMDATPPCITAQPNETTAS